MWRTLPAEFPPLVSRSGHRVSVVDTLAPALYGLAEQVVRGLGPPTRSAWRRMLGRWAKRFDRRWAFHIYHPPERTPTRWIYVIQVKQATWRRQFGPIVDRLLAECSDLGAILTDEVPRGQAPKMAFLGNDIPVRPRRPWRRGTSPSAPSPPELDETAAELLAASRDAVGMQEVILQRWLNRLETACGRWPPAAVLVNSDLERIRRATCLFAQSRGLPAVNIQHGMINRQPIYSLGLCDRHLLWGEAFQRILRDAGAPPEALVPVGAPHYDELATTRRVDRPRGRRYLYATQPPCYEVPKPTCEHLLELHRRLAQTLPDLEVIIRHHPRDADDLKRRVADWANDLPNLTQSQGTDIFDALADCDVIGTVFSTVSLDAAILRRPTVLLDFAGQGHRFPFERRPPWFAAPTEQSLPQAIDAALAWSGTPVAEASWRQFDQDVLAGLDGGSVDRAARAILDLIG